MASFIQVVLPVWIIFMLFSGIFIINFYNSVLILVLINFCFTLFSFVSRVSLASHFLRVMPPKPYNKKISKSYIMVQPLKSGQVCGPCIVFVLCLCLLILDIMVGCESCSRWSHSQCVGISPSYADSYSCLCPFCVTGLCDDAF